MSIDWKKINVLHNDAKNSFHQMEGILQKAMRLTFPGRNYFNQSSEDAGDDKQKYIFDNTAQYAANVFVNSLSELLFPNQFFKFEVGVNVPIQRRESMQKELDRLTHEYHQLINQTFYKNSITESLSDAAVSTGFIEIRENKGGYGLTNPISFHSSPLCKTYFVEHNDMIVSTWRENETKFHSIKSKYPYVNWSTVNYKDDDLIKIIDGCVYNPRSEDDEEPFVFYLDDSDDDSNPFYHERRSYPSRFGFGMDRFAIGSYRNGQILKILPNICTVNSIAEMNWLAIQYNSMPLMLVQPERFENPAMLRLTPGSTIKINDHAAIPSQGTSPPAMQVPFNLNSQDSETRLSALQESIAMALFAVSPPSEKVRTATEVSMQDNSRTQGIARASRRLKGELLDQFIKYSVKGFRRNGFMVRDNPAEKFVIDDDNIAICYNNIFTNSDDMNVVNSINTYRESIQPWVGEQLGMQTLDMAKLPDELANRLNLPVGLVRSENEVSQMIKVMEKSAQQQQQVANQQADQEQVQNQASPSGQESQPVNPLQSLGNV